jgi:membrane protein
VDFSRRVFTTFVADEGTIMAAGSAYFLFLSLFPLIIGLIGLIGLFVSSQTVQAQLLAFLQNNAPAIADILESNIQNIIRLRGTLGIIGVVGLIWLGSSAVSTIGHAINIAWDIKKGLPYFPRKLRDIVFTFGLGILIFLSIIASGALSFSPLASVYFTVSTSAGGRFLIRVVVGLLAFLFAFAVFLILFKVMPNTRTYWRFTWLGALLTAIFFVAGQIVMFIYFDRFSDYTQIYGSIASIVVLLVWIYYSALIVIIGAEFTSEYSRMRRGISRGRHAHATEQTPGT